jgi:hypothetical protein
MIDPFVASHVLLPEICCSLGYLLLVLGDRVRLA